MAVHRVPDRLGASQWMEGPGAPAHFPAPGALEGAELSVSLLRLGHLRQDGTPRGTPLADPSCMGRGGEAKGGGLHSPPMIVSRFNTSLGLRVQSLATGAWPGD